MSDVEAFFNARWPDNDLARNSMTSLYRWFSGSDLADRIFDEQISCGNDDRLYQRTWEMVLAKHLHDLGYVLESDDIGPDFSFTYADNKIWIEAVCPQPNQIPDSWLNVSSLEDFLSDPDIGVAEVPVDEILLRFTQCVAAKKNKLVGYFDRRSGRWRPGYIENEIVKDNEPYVIAVSESRLETGRIFRTGLSQKPYILEAVLPWGPIEHIINTLTGETESRISHRPAIGKQSENGTVEPIRTDAFLNDDFNRISAVLSAQGGVNQACGDPPEIFLVHNPNALNPLPEGILGATKEYTIEVSDGALHCNDIMEN